MVIPVNTCCSETNHNILQAFPANAATFVSYFELIIVLYFTNFAVLQSSLVWKLRSNSWTRRSSNLALNFALEGYTVELDVLFSCHELEILFFRALVDLKMNHIF